MAFRSNRKDSFHFKWIESMDLADIMALEEEIHEEIAKRRKKDRDIVKLRRGK